jgi:hypothetical protein
MANKSIFRAFMSNLRKRWKKELPSISPLTGARGRFPKASSFYAGKSGYSGQHVHLYFQHSCKAWEVGQFTINVVLSLDEHNPQMSIPKSSDPHFGDGYHRIGFLIGSKDKWWHLKQDGESILTESWRPSSYEDEHSVLSQAVDDVTRDIVSAMRVLDVPIENSTSTV